MARIDTAFTRLLGIQVPVVSAPMANASTAKLAVQVTLGGGFGFIQAGYGTAAHLREELASARSILHSSGHPNSVRLPIGVGYLGWKLDEAGDTAYAMLDAALQSNVRAIWLSFGADLGKWVNYVRESDKQTGRKTHVFIQVNSVDESVMAVNTWKADVLVAQGIEAGGHGGSYAPPVFTLISNILAALPQAPPLLAAGGIANGAQVAAYLALGASGAVLGTRFLLTPESLYSAPQKAALIAADSTSTVRTLAFDRARNTLDWPAGVDGRGLRNKLVQDVEDGVDISAIQGRLAEGTKHGLPDYSIIWAGTGVGQMHDLMDAQDIVKELYLEISQRLRAVASCLHAAGLESSPERGRTETL